MDTEDNPPVATPDPDERLSETPKKSEEELELLAENISEVVFHEPAGYAREEVMEKLNKEGHDVSKQDFAAVLEFNENKKQFYFLERDGRILPPSS